MSRPISSKMIEAMKLVADSQRKKRPISPYAAAKKVGIALSTMYNSSLYKEYKAKQATKGKKRGNHAN